MHRFPRRSRSLKVVLAGLILLPMLVACSSGDDDGRPSVVASFYPLQFVADRIVGDLAQVSNLTSPGVEPSVMSGSSRPSPMTRSLRPSA